MKNTILILLLFISNACFTQSENEQKSLSECALELTKQNVTYDLQKEVHEDMKANFNVYPKIWGLNKTDRNIDHRRVPNLMTFFKRKRAEELISNQAEDYLPGDVVCWNLGGAITHIGVVVTRKSNDGKRNLIVHNIGGGQVLEDCLFHYKIIGHYRYKT